MALLIHCLVLVVKFPTISNPQKQKRQPHGSWLGTWDKTLNHYIYAALLERELNPQTLRIVLCCQIGDVYEINFLCFLVNWTNLSLVTKLSINHKIPFDSIFAHASLLMGIFIHFSLTFNFDKFILLF